MDEIIIENFTLRGKHGCLAEEKILGQNFIYSVKIKASLQKAGLSDDLTQSINYAEVCEKIRAISERHSYDLIEALAEKIAEEILLTYDLAQEVTVKIKKPNAPVPEQFDYMGVCITRKKHIAFIGLGSNMGDKASYLELGIQELQQHPLCKILAKSSQITTAPVGYTQQDDFLNGAVKIETLLEPEELLDLLLETEQKANRVRKIHWGPRTLDMDLLLYDQEIIRTNRLNVPHPELHKRAFALIPLCEIDPYAVHPLRGRTMQDLLEELQA